MTEHRTEDEAEAGLIRVSMGGERFTLPVLTIEKSEEWQAEVGAELSALDDGLGSGDGTLGSVLQRGGQAMRTVVLAYDVGGVLGGDDGIRKRMTQRELWQATESMIDAEFPFDEAARRSVAEMFGLPLKALEIVSKTVMEEASRQAKYPSGPSPIGESTTPASDESGPVNNSSSDGRTDNVAPRKRTKRKSST